MNEPLDTTLIKKVSTFIGSPDDQNWCIAFLVRDIILVFNLRLLVPFSTGNRVWVLNMSALSEDTMRRLAGHIKIKHWTGCRYKDQPLFRTF